MIYMDPPFFTNRKFIKSNNDGIVSFHDVWNGGISEYLFKIKSIAKECKRVLKDTGSIYVHCDWHASHYIKITLDEIFGYENFRNEIVWRRHNSHNDAKQGTKILGRVHDVIMLYSKGKNPTWNTIYQKYSEEYVNKVYRHVEKETGRRYAHGDLGGPGGVTKGNPHYTFLGISRYWRYSKENMQRMFNEGKVIQTKLGNTPVLKRYLDEMEGIQLQDVWDDIKPVQFTKRENAKYPTQKPIKLLERLISLSTNEKDVVLDPFCGSGTTLVAAHNLGRKWIGIDSNPDACKIARNRIEERKVLEKMTIKAKILKRD